ncbi:hypothetical protein MHU86_22752 [Fragilaria crotonensis]|nr:hypothetical protein MHU86_22752 [Fragilaria crotonensis]
MQAEGWEVFDEHFLQLDAVLGTMESLLCFEAWLDQYTFWDIGDPDGEASQAEAAIASLMNLITTHLPRHAGNGWKLSKFHEIKHIVRFIAAFGAPRGYNASVLRNITRHTPNVLVDVHRRMWTPLTSSVAKIADALVIDTMHAMFQERPVLKTSSQHTNRSQLLAADDVKIL